MKEETVNIVGGDGRFDARSKLFPLKALML